VSSAAATPRSTPAMIRELARNLERTLAGSDEEVCLAGLEGQGSCACYRDAHHEGRHRCTCGAEWGPRPPP
jgi:hypothetical protein